MRRLRWMMARSPLGWPGMAGALLMALAVAAQALWLPRLQARLDDVAQAAHGPATARRADDAAGHVERFYAHFREAGAVPAQLAKLERAAGAQGLALRQGEYRLAGEDGARLARYHVTLPVAGSYPAVRRFLGEVLDTLPTAALDAVSFERKSIGEGRVEAVVRLTLYVER